MKINRTKNAVRNIVFGMLLKIYQIAVPFLMRTAMIYYMGVQYLGLNSLFSSILQVLNLAELGVGSAMVFSMYKPIAEDDKTTICALMRMYRTYYRIIGAVIGVIGGLITPFIPYLIKSDLPAGLNIYALYLLNLAATVLSYWLFAYKNCLISAHQRNDIGSKIQLVTNTIQFGIQLVIIIYIRNYYLYLIVMLAMQVVTNICTAIVANRMFPAYVPEGRLDPTVTKKINGRIRDLFTAKLGGVVVGSVDTIVISAFLGLTVLAVYQNYYFILSSVIGFISIVFGSCTAGIGNSIIVESKQKNYDDLKKFTFIISWITGTCVCCFACLYQPFMELWVGKELMLEFSAVICFCIYFFVFEINQLLNTYKDAAGIWHEDRFRPLVTAIVNLSLNLLMVQFLGVYGIILSTVLSMLFVGMPWLLHNLFTILFDKKELYVYLLRLGFYAAVSFVVCLVCCIICFHLELSGFMGLIVRGIVCVLISNISFYFAYCKMPEFSQSILLVDRMTKGKFKLTKYFEVADSN